MNGGGYVGGFFIGVHMPPRTPKTCRVRGYRNTTTDPSGYCKTTKAKAGSNTSRASPVISAVMVRGVVPHALQSCAGGEETGHSHRFLWVDAIPFWIIPMPFMQGLYQTFVMAVRLTGPPGGGGLPRGGSVAEKG